MRRLPLYKVSVIAIDNVVMYMIVTAALSGGGGYL